MAHTFIKTKSLRERLWKSLNILVGISTVLNVSMAGALLAPHAALAASQSASLDQCANDPLPSSHLDGCSASASDWVSGNLGASKSNYIEGDFIPYRMVMDNLSLASHTLTVEWDTTKASKHAIDYLGTYNQTVATVIPCLGVSGCGAPTTFPIPNDPQVTGAGVTPTVGNFTMFGGTITSVSTYTYSSGAGFVGDKSTSITMTFTATQANPVLAWSGHIAHRNDWGVSNSAVAISGSPYHTRLVDLDGSGGNQDRSLSADAVIFPASITVIKQATPEGTQSFGYTASPSPLTNFYLVDDGTTANTKVFSGITNFTTYTVGETPPAGWTLNSIVCGVTSANGGAQTVTSPAVAINLKEGENVTCTFNNERQAATVNVVKHVINDNGGTRVASDFAITATSAGASPAAFNGSETGTLVTVNPGVAYTITETTQSGYAVSYSADCNSSVAAGQQKTCTITNNDIQPKLTVTKVIINNNGGTKVISDFPLFVNATGVTSGVQNGFNAATYTVSETNQSGYSSTISGDCATNGSVTLAAGDVKSCTITNDDQAGTLIVQKVLVHDNGGNNGITSFSFKVNDGSNIAFEADAENAMTVNAGTYSVVENAASGYTTTYNNCSNVIVPNGGSATCVITNNDVAPTITLNKVVTNNNGGNAGVNSFGLTVGGNSVTSGQTVSVNANTPVALNEAGLTGYAFVSLTGTGCPSQLGGTASLNEGQNITCTITNDDVQPKLTVTKVVVNDNGGNAVVSNFPLFVNATGVTSGAQAGFNAGSYTVSETQLAGYDLTGISGDCASNGTITLAVGDVKSCTITNNDIAPKLTLVKFVTNNNGGDAVVSNFPLFRNGSQQISGVEYSVSSNTLYTATETTLPGYTSSVWGGDCAANGTITLNEGDVKTCTITNDDAAPTLKLVKVVTTNNGGTKTSADWTLTASGDQGFSDLGNSTTFHTVLANKAYTLSESVVAGYTAGNWICDGGALNGNVVTLEVDQDITCTITNNDQPGTLIVKKVLINDNGGNAAVTDFSFTVNGGSSMDFEADAQNDMTVDSGLYTVVENTANGYATTYDNCSEVFVPNGGSATCTITNNDTAPTITLNKVVINNNGGTAGVNDFSLTIGGSPAVSGTTYDVDANTSYALDEAGLTGYAFVSLTGDERCPAVLGGSVNLNEGEKITCTITNDDVQPKLTVTKVVVNDNGGTKVISDFPLFVNQTSATSGVQNGLNAGAYVVSETQQLGYTGVISGDCDANGNVTLNVGDVKSCTITNNDVQPKLTVIKVVLNDQGGTKVASDFPLFVGTTNVASGVQNGFNAGTYAVSETNQSGYGAPVFSGDCNALGQILLSAGEVKTCTITNNDIAPNLSITKANNVASFANPGNTVTYTVVVTNSASATDTARGVVLHDVLPTGFTYVIGGGTSKDFALGDIAPGASVTTTYDVVVSASQVAGTYTNTATAKGNNTVVVTATSNVEVRVPQVLAAQALPSLTLTKTVNKNVTTTNSIVTYTVTITNSGDVDLTGVSLVDTLPPGFVFVEGGTRNKTFAIGSLAAHHVRVLNYDVRVTDSVKAGKHVNIATVLTNELDPRTAKVSIEVRKPRVLGLATTGVGLRDYLVFSTGLVLMALGFAWTSRLRRRYGRDSA